MNLVLGFAGLILFIIILMVTYYLYYRESDVKIMDHVIIIFLTVVFGSAIYGSIDIGKDINNRINITIPDEIVYEHIIVQDSILTDQALYELLINMNVKHADVVLAQAKLESANYTSNIFLKNNNLFGMKQPSVRVTTSTGARAGYASYDTWRDSVIDYVLWMTNRNLNKLTKHEYIQFLNKVYAEDPDYDKKINQIIDKMKGR